jgi:hypothetical protein
LTRLGNILYWLCRLAAILSAVVGEWYAYWAPDYKIVVFMLFFGPGLCLWFAAKFVRFVVLQFR